MKNVDTYTSFEKDKWNQYFDDAIQGKGQEQERQKSKSVEVPSSWWQIADIDTISIVKKYFESNSKLDILEAGCGSGKSSFTLVEELGCNSLTLSDISSKALEFAQTMEPAQLSSKMKYVKAGIQQMPFPEEVFDLTWNIGVIEHYPLDIIKDMVEEMLRVTKTDGYVIVAIPNRNSIATLKAWLLGTNFGRRFLRFIPGYRFDTERLYSNKKLAKFLSTTFSKEVKIEFAGNLLWVGAPNFLVSLTNRLFSKSPISFLSFFIVKK